MVNRGGCVVCAGQVATEEHNLAVEHPELLPEWHPTRNGGKKPEDFRSGSNVKVWWRCARGHEWRTMITKRALRGDGCRKCFTPASRSELRAYTEIVSVFPDAELEAKVHVFEVDIRIPSLRVGIEVDGYPWHTPASRVRHDELKAETLRDAGIRLIRLRDEELASVPCDHLVPFQMLVHKANIDKVFDAIGEAVPDLPAETRRAISAYKHRRRYVNSERYRKLCTTRALPPAEASLEQKYPEIAAEWSYRRNTPLTPRHIYAQANERYWFHCPKCGNDYEAKVCHRTLQGTGCSYCGHRKVVPEKSFGALHPELVKELHPKLNGDLDVFTLAPQANRKLWWVCEKGHVYRAPVNRRVGTYLRTGKYSGCVQCFRNRGAGWRKDPRS